jgi:hypothetical protein
MHDSTRHNAGQVPVVTAAEVVSERVGGGDGDGDAAKQVAWIVPVVIVACISALLLLLLCAPFNAEKQTLSIVVVSIFASYE